MGHAALRDRAGGKLRAQSRGAAGHLLVRGLRPAAIRRADEIRKQYLLAELLRAGRGRGRHQEGSGLRRAAHRGALPAVRQPSRPCVSRWPAADQQALLHQRCGAEIYSRLSRFARSVMAAADTVDLEGRAGHAGPDIAVEVAADEAHSRAFVGDATRHLAVEIGIAAVPVQDKAEADENAA